MSHPDYPLRAGEPHWRAVCGKNGQSGPGNGGDSGIGFFSPVVARALYDDDAGAVDLVKPCPRHVGEQSLGGQGTFAAWV
jgi:hypothetical protein